MLIDLRSDTVTRPTPDMRRAMAEAEVGDDVYAEDPTVNLLQERAAALLGKEAALFVPTGTMGNLVAIYCHTERGQEVICEARSHVLDYELGGMGAVAGVIPRAVWGRDGGRLAWEDVRAAIRPPSPYSAETGLVCLENTHNMAGGTVLPLETVGEIAGGARDAGLPVHLDGARLFNAAAALGRPVAELAAPADSVMVALSKGLAAPAGSLLVGTRELVDRARHVRKRLGGGMRQAGVLAAAGLVAIESMAGRLADDHANARLIADCLAGAAGVSIDPESVETNIVIFDLVDGAPAAAELSARLKRRGVLANPVGPRRLRMVTHNDVSRDDCVVAGAAVLESLREP